MLRKRVGVLITLVLLVAVVVTFLTGFVAAALDLNRFVLHKYAAYLAIVMAAAHVVLHWRVLIGQVRRWLLAMAPPVPPRAAVVPDAGAAARVSRRNVLVPGLMLAIGTGAGRLWGAGAAAPAQAEGEDLGQVYHQWSMTSYAGILTKSFHFRPQPSPYKEYAGAPTVTLPPVPTPGGPTLEDVITRRRSVREYADRPVTLAEVSRLLHHATGITDRRDPTWWFRAVPSSGALFPIEVYPVLFGVAGAEPGVYHYDVQRHQLELVRAGDVRREMFVAAVSQEMVLGAAMVLVLTGIFSRVQWKYVDRSYRYVLLEAGHLGQNVYLEATALGLGPCGIGAFLDDHVNRLLGVDGLDEAALYLLAIGPAATR